MKLIDAVMPLGTLGTLGMFALTFLIVFVAMTASGQANSPTLAYTVDIVVGHDVYFRRQPLHHDPDDVVRTLSQGYGANTLYVVYAGQTSFEEAVALYGRWGEAGKKYGVDIIPVASIVNNYIGPAFPEWVLGTIDKQGVGSMLDPANPQVQKLYSDFVANVDATLAPRYFGVFEFNDYSIGVFSNTYPKGDPHVWETWIKALSSQTKGKPAMTFQQPWGVGLPWLESIHKMSLDTYGFIRDGQWDALREYVGRAVSIYPEVDADLIILDDYGAELPGWRQRQAADVFKQVGVAGLNMDLMIISAVAWDQKGEDFWEDILSDGHYDGFYSEAFDEVVRIYREWGGQ